MPVTGPAQRGDLTLIGELPGKPRRLRAQCSCGSFVKIVPGKWADGTGPRACRRCALASFKRRGHQSVAAIRAEKDAEADKVKRIYADPFEAAAAMRRGEL